MKTPHTSFWLTLSAVFGFTCLIAAAGPAMATAPVFEPQADRDPFCCPGYPWRCLPGCVVPPEPTAAVPKSKTQPQQIAGFKWGEKACRYKWPVGCNGRGGIA